MNHGTFGFSCQTQNLNILRSPPQPHDVPARTHFTPRSRSRRRAARRFVARVFPGILSARGSPSPRLPTRRAASPSGEPRKVGNLLRASESTVHTVVTSLSSEQPLKSALVCALSLSLRPLPRIRQGHHALWRLHQLKQHAAAAYGRLRVPFGVDEGDVVAGGTATDTAGGEAHALAYRVRV